MAFIDTAVIGSTYSFSTNASYLGNKITNAQLVAILNYDIARKFDNIDLKYRIIYPNLPSGTPDSPESSQYFLFNTESGDKLVLADVWINDSTVKEVGFISFKIIVSKASLADIDVVRSALSSLGYLDFTVEQIT